MKRIFIDILNHVDRVPNLDEMLKKEYTHSAELKEKGILNHMFVKSDNTGAYLVVTADDIDKAKELITTFPMYAYFEKVDYSYIDDEF